jgi:stage III sporulation protein AB
MLNLIGASCIFIAGSMLGGFKAAGYRKRPQQIRQLITSLHYLCTEIDYGLSPLLSALRQTALTTSSPVSAIYMNTVEQMTTDRLALSQAWKLAVELSRPKLDLFPAELEVLAQLGQSLGISNRNISRFASSNFKPWNAKHKKTTSNLKKYGRDLAS